MPQEQSPPIKLSQPCLSKKNISTANKRLSKRLAKLRRFSLNDQLDSEDSTWGIQENNKASESGLPER